MASSLRSQPESGRAFSRPIRRHPRRYETTAARDTINHQGNLARVTVDEAQARAIAIEHLDNPSWEPAVTEVEDAEDAWRVFYNSRTYVETGTISDAIAGNLPLLVSKETGAVDRDLTFLPQGHPLVRASPRHSSAHGWVVASSATSHRRQRRRGHAHRQ